MNTRIRIATWNLERPSVGPSARNTAIIKQLRAINADVWVLTETNIAIVPGEHYNSWATPARPAPWKPGERATMIWSRLPIRQTIPTFAGMAAPHDIEISNPLTYAVIGDHASPAVCVEVLTPFGPFLIYGTMITWFADRGPQGVSPNHEEQQHSIRLHRDDWVALREQGALCVAGDLNVHLPAGGSMHGASKTTQTLLTDALTQADLVCTTSADITSIDHICLSSAWAERASKVVQWQAYYGDDRRPVSDHQGLYVDIDIT